MTSLRLHYRRRIRHTLTSVVRVGASRNTPPSSDYDLLLMHYKDWVEADTTIRRLESANSEWANEWSKSDLDHLEQASYARVEAAGRIWSVAPSHYNWDDVHRVCQGTLTQVNHALK